jgi:hypothetical protein
MGPFGPNCEPIIRFIVMFTLPTPKRLSEKVENGANKSLYSPPNPPEGGILGPCSPLWGAGRAFQTASKGGYPANDNRKIKKASPQAGPLLWSGSRLNHNNRRWL